MTKPGPAKGCTFDRDLNPIFYTYGGRRLRKKLMARAQVRAEKIVENMSKQVDFADDRAKKAVQTLVETLEAKLPNGLSDAGENADASTYVYSIRDRHNAAALLLKYTQVLPATKSEVVIQTAEAWLEQLAEDE
jgi:hypothetical protein